VVNGIQIQPWLVAKRALEFTLRKLTNHSSLMDDQNIMKDVAGPLFGPHASSQYLSYIHFFFFQRIYLQTKKCIYTKMGESHFGIGIKR
jgi:hypothetical protein